MATVLTITMLVVLAALVVLGATAVVARGLYNRRLAHAAMLTAPIRPLLMRLAADDEEAEAALAELSAIDDERWRLIEPNAVALLSKVKGGARESLVDLFARRGTVDRAMRDLRRTGVIRRAGAIETLGLLDAQEAFPELCGLLQDRIPEVRMVAARALGRLRNPAGAAPLLRSLAGGGTPAGVVAKALVRIGPAGAPALGAALVHDDPLVRATAAQVLGLIGPTPAADRLIPMLVEEPYIEVQTMAVRSLGQLGTRAALTALRRAAGPHTAPALRAEVADALGEFGAVETLPELSRLVEDPHYRVAHEAAHALARLGPEGIRELMALSVAPNRVAGAHAEEALGGIRLELQRTALKTARAGAGRGAGSAPTGRGS